MPRRAPPRLRHPTAAFVVTLALAPACQKRPPDTHGSKRAAHVTRAGDGTCRYHHAESPCPEGALCNPPPPVRIECPAGGDGPVADEARPPGKAGWYRIPSQLFANPYHGCTFVTEGYCAPVSEDRCEHGAAVKVPCKPIDPQAPPDQRRFALEAFEYRDSFGVCRRVPAMECKGDCSIEKAETVACADAGK